MHLGGWVHCEAELGLLAVVHGQALQQQGTQSRASTSSNGVEHQEALQTCGTDCICISLLC